VLHLPTIELPRINTGSFVFGDERRETAVIPFIDFVGKANPKYKWYPHVRQLADILQQIADGRMSRVMVFMPPRHGKTELVSRLFSAYYLYRHPDHWVGLNSYGADLAYTFSRNAKDNYLKWGGQIRGDASAVKHWETGKGGGMWAAGVGGPITGKGAHLAIIDDPIKNAEEAHSEIIRAKHKDWYDSTLYTRLEPGASIIVIQTRWHEDDLSGYLLANEDDEPEEWHIVHFEAIKENEIPTYPDTCTIEPDGRIAGEPLAPERYTLGRLRKIAGRIGPYFWAALYQQRPAPREGGMFKREWFEIVPGIPQLSAIIKFVRYWDKAGTKDAGAYTAGILMCQVGNIYYIVDLVMGQWAAPEREQIIKQTAQMDITMWGDSNNHRLWYTVVVEQEPGSGGKESAEATISNLAGFNVKADRPTGDKELRAEPFAAQAGINNVKLVANDWNGRFLNIITAFPNGRIKDPVDASTGAFNELTSRQYAPMKVVSYV
jgi:predicted phage terminase large subunit-like protein